jgi:hypothetical protein
MHGALGVGCCCTTQLSLCALLLPATRRAEAEGRGPISHSPIPPNGGVRSAPRSPPQRLGGGRCDTSLKNSKSAIKLLQVVLAGVLAAKSRVFASKHAQQRHALPQ